MLRCAMATADGFCGPVAGELPVSVHVKINHKSQEVTIKVYFRTIRILNASHNVQCFFTTCMHVQHCLKPFILQHFT